MSPRTIEPATFWGNLVMHRQVAEAERVAFDAWTRRFSRYTGPCLAQRMLSPLTPGRTVAVPEEAIAHDRLLGRLRAARYAEVIDLLADAGVATVSLAGYASDALLYGGRGARLIGDLDLLLAPAQLDPAVARLKRAGFRFVKAKAGPFGSIYRGSLPPFVSHDRVVNLDLHVAADMALPERALPVREVFDRAAPDARASGALPAPEHHLLMLAAKASRDRFEGEAVRKVVDLALLVANYGTKLDWQEVADRAARAQIDRPLRVVLALYAALVGPTAGFPDVYRRPPGSVPGPAFRRLAAAWSDLAVPWSEDCGVLRRLAYEWAFATNFRMAFRRDMERLWSVVPPTRVSRWPTSNRMTGGA